MRVLTAPGGEFAVSDEMRNMFAYLEDGRLLVAKTYAFNPHVRGFISRLQHLGREFQVHHTDLAVVRECYEGGEKGEEHSDMQRAAAMLFSRAVKSRASDIHIRVSDRHNTRIFFRIHNDLEFIEEHPFQYGDQLCTTIFQAMADVSDSTFEKLSPQDARISDKSKIPNSLDGIRVATSPQVGGYIMVLRLLYNDTSDNIDLASLGYADEQTLAVEYMKKRPTGVIIIAGPTGSGKSTTLQRVLSAIIRDSMGRKHIITVEDPPEYPIPGAVQTPVTNADTEEQRSREYQKAIKAAMRLDPDIIMLSEVRDNPTARLVVQAAMTGHQVWTTVHANGALAIIDRFQDLGVPRELLSDPTVIAGLVCQRLVKVLCPSCKKPLMEHLNDFKPDDVRRIMSAIDIKNAHVLGDGCEQCNGSGTIGRTVISESIVTDNTLMKFIRSGDKIGAHDYVRREQGVKTMLEHAIQKINEGIIDPFQAEDVVGALNSGIIERDHRITSEEIS
jgi:general secretion pathway protein E